MAQGWRFYLGNSSDMSLIGRLPHADGRQLQVDLNKSGQATCASLMRDEIARKAYPWETCLIAQHDRDLFWSGPVVMRNRNWASGTISITANGWFERLMNLKLQEALTFTDADAGSIAQTLLGKAIEQDPTVPITIGIVEPTQPRTISYAIDQNIGQAIIDLCELEAGFDWEVHPVTRQLNIFAKISVDRPNVRWAFKEHGNCNLADLDDSLDGTSIANRFWARGKFSSGFGELPESIDRIGVFEDTGSLSDITDQNILDAYANEEVVFRGWPRATFTLTPKPESKASVPKLFRDFNIGDINYLDAERDGQEIIDQALRVFGVTLDIDKLGVGTLSNLQTTAS